MRKSSLRSERRKGCGNGRGEEFTTSLPLRDVVVRGKSSERVDLEMSWVDKSGKFDFGGCCEVKMRRDATGKMDELTQESNQLICKSDEGSAVGFRRGKEAKFVDSTNFGRFPTNATTSYRSPNSDHILSIPVPRLSEDHPV